MSLLTDPHSVLYEADISEFKRFLIIDLFYVSNSVYKGLYRATLKLTYILTYRVTTRMGYFFLMKTCFNKVVLTSLI